MQIKSNDQYCGFSSMGMLREWFKGCLDLLLSNGFKIMTYQVDYYDYVDEKQILFKKQVS